MINSHFCLPLRADTAAPRDAREVLLSYTRLQYSEDFWTRFWGRVEVVVDRVWERTKGRNFGERGKYWEKVEEVVRGMMLENMKTTAPCEPSLPLSWIICLDEARCFNLTPPGCAYDILTHMLRAARLIPRGSILLYMDTLSELNVLFPSTVFSSERMRMGGCKMGVYTDLTTWDIGAHMHKDQIPKTIQESVRTGCMSLYGRPYWSSLRDVGDVDEIIKAAGAKLCATYGNLSTSKVSNLALLAAIANRVNIDVNPAFRLTPELVGSHLGYLDHYDEEMGPKVLHISYPSDPIVSAAASMVFQTHPALIGAALEQLRAHAQSRMVEPGERGELVAQILCTLVMEELAKSTKSAIPVRAFLEMLCGSDYSRYVSKGMENDGMGETLLSGLMNFNHFIKVAGYTPSREDMAGFLRRRAAIVCKDCQWGIDLIIPIVLPKAFDKPVSRPATTVESGEAQGKISASLISLSEAETVRLGGMSPSKLREAGSLESLTDLADSDLTELLGRLEDRNGGGLREIQPNPALEKILTREKETASAAVPTLSAQHEDVSHVKGDMGEGIPIEASHVSYILIQCKNHRSAGGFFPKQLEMFNPFDAGIEQGGPRSGTPARKRPVPESEGGEGGEDGTAVPLIEYPRENRPYVALGLFFNNTEKCDLRELETYPKSSSHNKDFISLALVNGHRRAAQFRILGKGAANVVEVLEELLAMYPSTLDLARSGCDVTVKSAQKYGYKGTELKVDPFTDRLEL